MSKETEHGPSTYIHILPGWSQAEYAYLKGEIMPKGTEISILRTTDHKVIHGSFVYEIAPWHKDDSLF